MAKLFNAVYVRWVDSEHETETWKQIEDLHDELHVLDSFGILIKETDKLLALAVSYDRENETACAIQFIPKACIIEIREGSLHFKKVEDDD